MIQRSVNKQLLINMMSGVGVFLLNLCVSFFLTPYIVSKLGTAAYGYIGLTNNLIGYTALITVAVNSMAGRFITISFHENDLQKANSYYSSIFYTNIGLSVIIIIIFTVMMIFLQDIIKIPYNLISDVKILFVLLSVTSCLSLITGVISVYAFIRNRLEISNIRNLIGSFIRVAILLILFGFFSPHLWYIGLTIFIMNLYVIISNYYYSRLLTPELRISRRSFNFKRVIEVTKAGAWNLISRMSEILSRGFDLLLANWFISATAMGILSITQTIPSLILSFFGALSGNFAPEFARLYAIKDYDGLKKELMKAIRLSGFMACIPLSIFYAYGDIFYSLWLPSENASELYLLSCLGTFGMIFGLPQEPLWYIFTATNRVKKSSLNLFYNSLCIFATVLLCMLIIKDDMMRLMALACTRTIYGTIRVTTFLPGYGAKCLGFNRWTFYPLIFKNLINVLTITAISLVIKYYLIPTSWFGLIFGSMFTCIISIAISSQIVLQKKDRTYLSSLVKQKLRIA